MLGARAIDDRLPLARLAGRCPLLDPSRRAHSRPRHPWTLCALGVCYSSAGKVAEVEAIRDELTARARRESPPPLPPSRRSCSTPRVRKGGREGEDGYEHGDGDPEVGIARQGAAGGDGRRLEGKRD